MVRLNCILARDAGTFQRWVLCGIWVDCFLFSLELKGLIPASLCRVMAFLQARRQIAGIIRFLCQSYNSRAFKCYTIKDCFKNFELLLMSLSSLKWLSRSVYIYPVFRIASKYKYALCRYVVIIWCNCRINKSNLFVNPLALVPNRPPFSVLIDSICPFMNCCQKACSFTLSNSLQQIIYDKNSKVFLGQTITHIPTLSWQFFIEKQFGA